MNEISLTVGILGGIALLITHTGALFLWGGRVSAAVQNMEKIVNDHEDRLRDLEKK